MRVSLAEENPALSGVDAGARFFAVCASAEIVVTAKRKKTGKLKFIGCLKKSGC
jgi:hypothetical protein